MSRRRILIGIRRIPLQEGVTPSVIDMKVDVGKHNSSDDTTVPESVPPLSTPDNTAGNTSGKSSYANIISKPSGMKVKVHTLFTPGGNGIDVVVPVDSIRAISARFANISYGFFMAKKVVYPVVANYVRNTWGKYGLVRSMLGRSSYARVMIELRADVELKDNIIKAMPKITREGHYTCNNTNVGKEKTVKKPSQASRCVLVGPKMAFKSQKEYRHFTKKPNTSSSDNKKKGVKPTIEVSNSNPFNVFNSVNNDVEFGTNGGTSNLGNNEATPSGSSFMYIDNDGEFASNTSIGEKIDKIERQFVEGKLRVLDNDWNPLVPTGIVESDSEVDVVYDETANLMIPTSGSDRSDKDYGTNSLLEQWRDSYPDNNDYDPYDDDMYENHDLSEHLPSICDDLDIMRALSFFLCQCIKTRYSDPRFATSFLLRRHVRKTITITSTQNTDGIVQVEEVEEKPDDSVLSTQEYMKQVVEDVGEEEDFNSGQWVGATEYVIANGGIISRCLGDIKTFLKNGKLEQVVAIIKSCSLNAVGDLKVTVKDLSGTLPGSIHYKVINEGDYGKEITVGSVIILANVLVFSPNPSMYYLNITKKNMVKVFHKDFLPEEEMADLELHVCGNVIDQEDLYKFDKEALDLVLEEKERELRAHEEWLEKCRQQEEEDTEHERQLLGKEPDSTSAPKEKVTRTTGKSTQRSKSQQNTASESARAEEPMQTTQDLEEHSHQEFETCAIADQHIAEASQHTEWFQQQKKPPTPDSAWNKTLPASHRSIQPWISDLAKQADSRSSFNEDDDKLYKFKEGDFKRLRIQDIEDMLLLLVHGKLTNLTVEERFAFNVSLRMFTRSSVIQRRVKDLQLGVENYQKKLNLINPDTYRSDLKRKKAYTTYSNPRGFIYQNKDKQNRLMRIDELHKFNDGTLNDVRTALDDHLKGIRMKYLPQAIWGKSEKERASAMIQAIDNKLKTRRIMRSLEKFVGGRLYEGDFRMLRRTI
uniref:Homologous recombination OB-fold protein OB-fold domain-containing protein n=1 Tax=Tanacetum cinerariifolium TaxID=118510 RepID=A0A6L2MD04_TANCI|nr:hypothetical protein [Tanacetum cinerariifolium]